MGNVSAAGIYTMTRLDVRDRTRGRLRTRGSIVHFLLLTYRRQSCERKKEHVEDCRVVHMRVLEGVRYPLVTALSASLWPRIAFGDREVIRSLAAARVVSFFRVRKRSERHEVARISLSAFRKRASAFGPRTRPRRRRARSPLCARRFISRALNLWTSIRKNALRSV